MKIFSKKEKPIENIAFIGVASAITIIFVTLLSLFNFLIYFFALFLPLFATLVAIFCKKRYFPIYVITTTLICSLLFFNRIEIILFTLVPSLITGFLFGLFIKYEFPMSMLILVTSLFQTLFSAFSLSICGLIIGKGFNFTYIFETLGISGINNIESIFLPALFIFSIAQVVLSLIITINETEKFIKIKLTYFNDELYVALSINAFSIILFATSFFYSPMSYLSLIINLILSIYLAIIIIIKRPLVFKIIVGFLLLLSVFIFAGFYVFVPKDNSLLLLGIFPLLLAIYTYVILLLFKNNKLDRIKNRTNEE